MTGTLTYRQLWACGDAGGVLTCGKDHVLKMVDMRSYQVQAVYRAPGFTVSSAWCRACLGPDDKYLAAGSADGSLFVWEVRHVTLAVLSLLVMAKGREGRKKGREGEKNGFAAFVASFACDIVICAMACVFHT